MLILAGLLATASIFIYIIPEKKRTFSWPKLAQKFILALLAFLIASAVSFLNLLLLNNMDSTIAIAGAIYIGAVNAYALYYSIMELVTVSRRKVNIKKILRAIIASSTAILLGFNLMYFFTQKEDYSLLLTVQIASSIIASL